MCGQSQSMKIMWHVVPSLVITTQLWFERDCHVQWFSPHLNLLSRVLQVSHHPFSLSCIWSLCHSVHVLLVVVWRLGISSVLSEHGGSLHWCVCEHVFSQCRLHDSHSRLFCSCPWWHSTPNDDVCFLVGRSWLLIHWTVGLADTLALGKRSQGPQL